MQRQLTSTPFLCADAPLYCQDKVFTVLGVRALDAYEKYALYLDMLRKPFTKLCRLRFLGPDGTTAFALDNSPQNRRNQAFIAEGTLHVNLQNGTRRTADVTIANASGLYEYAVGKLWYGQEIALDEGLLLPNGEEFYIQQGVFVIKDPASSVQPGNLEGTHQVPVGTNVFSPITSLLRAERGNGIPVDNVTPVYTSYYDGKTQTLPSGASVPLTETPYTITIDSENGTEADIILALAETLNAWVGYDAMGRLRIDPSQDDILDTEKALIWEFSTEETTLLGMTYSAQNTEVYNDYIVTGEQLEDYSQPSARAQNLDPASPTNVNLIGRKTFRENKSGYVTDLQCQDYALWKLKRAAVLQSSVSIECSQIMHLEENKLVSIARTDKAGTPRELHLVTGFSRPLAWNGSMQITATSVNDLPLGTVE